MPIPEHDIYARLGEDGFTRIVSAFYEGVKTDDILGPMYRESIARTGESMAAAETRLREFLIQRFGGPDRYSATRGHPRLRMRHAPFAVDIHGAQRWVTLMERAMEAARIDEDVRDTLRPYFASTAKFMVNQD